MKQDIAIIGAGINGLALALSLRLFGIETRIYEQASEPRIEGTGVAIWPDGMQILAALISAKAIEEAGDATEVFDTCTAMGAVISQMSLAEVVPYHLAPLGMFHRREIYKLLVEHVGLDNIELNKKFVSLNEEKDYVQVNFTDGSNIQADIVIGADGIYSNVRQNLFPRSVLIDSGVSCCRGIAELETSLLNNESLRIFSGNKSRICSYSISRKRPLKYWFAACVLAEYESLNDRDSVLKRFSDYNPKLLELISVTENVEMIPSTLYELKPMPTWSKGRATW